ncbi:MAG: NADH-quinone oxidoreductase subunit C [Ilumatobacteraceae bacterium]
MAPLSDASVAALPGDALREGIVTALREHLGEALLDSLVKPGDDVWVRVRNADWRRTGEVLRDVLGCDYFCFISGIDWMPSPYGRGEDDPSESPPERDMSIRQGYAGGDTRMQVFARVVNVERKFGVTVKADVDDATPSIASWTQVYAGANWHERECHEMFGIAFEGHPDLRNMYLPSDFEGYPLRKDFPLLARMVRPWPGIADVEPLPGDESEDGE